MQPAHFEIAASVGVGGGVPGGSPGAGGRVALDGRIDWFLEARAQQSVWVRTGDPSGPFPMLQTSVQAGWPIPLPKDVWTGPAGYLDLVYVTAREPICSERGCTDW